MPSLAFIEDERKEDWKEDQRRREVLEALLKRRRREVARGRAEWRANCAYERRIVSVDHREITLKIVGKF